QSGGARPFRGGLLFDMVGDRSLGITLPANSPVEIARDIFAAAEVLKLRNYFTYLGRELVDDHVPLNAIGIPTLDIIDFDYPWWHTADDTIDKVSAQSLRIVGSVALYYLSEFALRWNADAGRGVEKEETPARPRKPALLIYSCVPSSGRPDFSGHNNPPSRIRSIRGDGFGCRFPGKISSARSAMFIACFPKIAEAPLGAACSGCRIIYWSENVTLVVSNLMSLQKFNIFLLE